MQELSKEARDSLEAVSAWPTMSTWPILAVWKPAIKQALAALDSAVAEAEKFRLRLIENANEEPPSGWLRRGEDGYENTPEGMREARDAAVAEVAKLKAEYNRWALTGPGKALQDAYEEGLWVDSEALARSQAETRAATASAEASRKEVERTTALLRKWVSGRIDNTSVWNETETYLKALAASPQPAPKSAETWAMCPHDDLASRCARCKDAAPQPATDPIECSCAAPGCPPSATGCLVHQCFVCGAMASEFGDDGGAPHDYRCAKHSRRSSQTTEPTQAERAAAVIGEYAALHRPRTSTPQTTEAQVRNAQQAREEALDEMPDHNPQTTEAPAGEAPRRIWLDAPKHGTVEAYVGTSAPNASAIKYVRADLADRAVTLLRQDRALDMIEAGMDAYDNASASPEYSQWYNRAEALLDELRPSRSDRNNKRSSAANCMVNASADQKAFYEMLFTTAADAYVAGMNETQIIQAVLDGISDHEADEAMKRDP
jgi:hypothetical protein